MRCPVCGAENKYELNKCNICGTDNINPDLVDEADIENWQERIDFEKEYFFLEENSPILKRFSEGFREELKSEAPKRTLIQLDIYFEYSVLKEKLNKNPNDYISRSWLVDYLVQIYTFPRNYPVSSRRYVREEIAKNIMLLMAVRGTTESERFQHTCNKAVLSLFNAEVELSDGNVSQAISHYYEFLTNPIVYQGILSLQANHNYIECADDLAFVVHNCKELCSLFSMEEEYLFTSIENKLKLNCLLTSMKDGSFYMHGMNCGLIGPTDSEDFCIFLKATKKDKCTLEQCSYKNKILKSGLNNLDPCCETHISTYIDENFNKTWFVEYRSLKFVLDETIEKQKYSIQSEMNKILMLFGF